MSVLWLLVIIPASFIAGFFIAAILASAGRDDAESYWRNQYFMERDSHDGTKKLLNQKGVVIWTLHNTKNLEIASTLNH